MRQSLVTQSQYASHAALRDSSYENYHLKINILCSKKAVYKLARDLVHPRKHMRKSWDNARYWTQIKNHYTLYIRLTSINKTRFLNKCCSRDKKWPGAQPSTGALQAAVVNAVPTVVVLQLADSAAQKTCAPAHLKTWWEWKGMGMGGSAPGRVRDELSCQTSFKKKVLPCHAKTCFNPGLPSLLRLSCTRPTFPKKIPTQCRDLRRLVVRVLAQNLHQGDDPAPVLVRDATIN